MIFTHHRSLASGSVGRRILGDMGAPRAIRLCADLMAVLMAFAMTLWLHQAMASAGATRTPVPLDRLQAFALVYAMAVVGTFAVLGLYRPKASVLNLWEVATTLRGLFISAAVVGFAAYGFGFGGLPRFLVAAGVAGSALLILLERRIVAAVLRTRQLRGVLGRRVLIIGAGPTGRLAMKRLIDAPHESRTVVGFLDDSAPIGSTVTCTTDQTTNAVIRRSVLGRLQDLEEVGRRFEVDEVLVDAASVEEDVVPKLVEDVTSAGLQFGLIPHLGEVRADRLGLEAIGGIPVLYPRETHTGPFYRAMNRIADLTLALSILGVTAPIWILVSLLIKVDSPGPVLFAQDRVGKGGRTFRMYKFRSMRQDTEAYANSPRGDADPRITRVGKALRRTGLDELPQLINVLRGEMAIVGPRPEMEFIVAGYTAYERRRLQAKPGITGIWQISPDRHGEIHHNVEYDLYYIDHQSLLLDGLILFETALRTAEMVVKGLLGAPRTSKKTDDLYAMPRDFEIRVSQEDEAPAVSDGTMVLEPGEAWRRDYLLVALDQRTAERGRPSSWDPVSQAAFAISCRWPVKMIAAEANRVRFNRILEKARSRMGSGQARIAFIAPENEWAIRAHIASAALVVTDVPEFVDWAMEVGVSSYSYPSGQRRVVGGTVAPRAVDELDQWLRLPGRRLPTAHLTLVSSEVDDE
ncbi:MAG: sugar transferase [Gemmatimonadota bacterium]|nr:sugar transferase [Gemmatimonadota bacterium]